MPYHAANLAAAPPTTPVAISRVVGIARRNGHANDISQGSATGRMIRCEAISIEPEGQQEKHQQQ